SSRSFLIATAPPATHTLSLHDALPICPPGPGGSSHRSAHPRHGRAGGGGRRASGSEHALGARIGEDLPQAPGGERRRPARLPGGDRKSTRLNSSHVKISYAVFCLKKKK